MLRLTEPRSDYDFVTGPGVAQEHLASALTRHGLKSTVAA